MQQLNLNSKIHTFQTCKEFIDAFEIKENDLIITCKYIYEPFFQNVPLPAQVIYQDEFGAGEPTDEMVLGMLSALSRDYERVIGIGGGTVLDISKLFGLKTITPLSDLFQNRFTPEKKCDLILVPTTCGTGSEVTNVSILGFPSLDTKLRLAVDELYAAHAVLIPELLSGLPREFFATSSIDALIHAIESSMSPLATPYSLMFGKEAMRLILSSFKRLKKEGFDLLPSLYEKFLLASNYAGIAFGKAGCGAVHAMSYPFSGKYHVCHGEANYVLLTGVLKKYAEKEASSRYADTIKTLADCLECSSSEVPEKLDELLSFILEKKGLHEYGTTTKDLPVFADSVLKYQQVIMSHNPATLEREDVIAIYKDCF